MSLLCNFDSFLMTFTVVMLLLCRILPPAGHIHRVQFHNVCLTADIHTQMAITFFYLCSVFLQIFCGNLCQSGLSSRNSSKVIRPIRQIHVNSLILVSRAKQAYCTSPSISRIPQLRPPSFRFKMFPPLCEGIPGRDSSHSVIPTGLNLIISRTLFSQVNFHEEDVSYNIRSGIHV